MTKCSQAGNTREREVLILRAPSDSQELGAPSVFHTKKMMPWQKVHPYGYSSVHFMAFNGRTSCQFV